MGPVFDRKALSTIIAKRMGEKVPEAEVKVDVEGEDDMVLKTPAEEVMASFIKALKAGDAKRAVDNFRRLMDICSMDDEDMEDEME